MSNNGLESKTVKNISVSLRNLRDILVSSVREYQDMQDDTWIKVSDIHVVNLILSTYGDIINRQILNCVSSNPHSIMEIVSQCDIPQTTGYSKIIALIESEFLVPYDKVQKKNSRQISRYISMFKELQMEISRNQVFIRARLSDFVKNQETV